MQALQQEIFELKRRVKELSLENQVLRRLCSANGLPYEEMLDAQGHRRYFAQLCADSPIQEAPPASYVLCVLPFGQHIAKFSGNILGVALTSRKVYFVF